MPNVLLTSVGRRSYLVDYFRNALAGNGKVIGANMHAEVPGMYAADVAVITPPAYSDEYVPALLDICKKYDVDLLCSLHDLDVYVLSQHSSEFSAAGVFAVLPTAKWGRATLDKYECTNLLLDHGIAVPWTSVNLHQAVEEINQGAQSFPVILKARVGFGSLGIEVCHNLEQLKYAHQSSRRKAAESGADRFLKIDVEESVLIQQLVTGRELCVGVVNDLTGCYRSHFVCKVHSMRAGESDVATSLDSRVAGDLPQQLSLLTRHAGIWGVDCMEDGKVLRVIDINPRFTGDYPFHHMAGADIPAALISWIQGNEPDPSNFFTTPGIRGFKNLVPTIVKA